MKRKRITRLPVSEDAKSTDIKSSKVSKKLRPKPTSVLKSETTQKEDTGSSSMKIRKLVKSEPLCSVEGTQLENSTSDNFKQTKSVAVINETTEESKDTATEQANSCDTEFSAKGLEMSKIAGDRVSELSNVPGFPTSTELGTSNKAIDEKETDVETQRKSDVSSVKEPAIGGNVEYLNDLKTIILGGSQELLCFGQSKSKQDSKHILQDAEKVLVVEMKQDTEPDETALQNLPESTQSFSSFSKSIGERDNSNQDKIMIFAKGTSDFLHARDDEINGKVENDSAMDTADIQKCCTKQEKYFTLGTHKLHIATMSTPAECVNDDETGLDDIRKDQLNMEVKNVDDNSEELDDDSLPESPYRVDIIDFNTTLPCSPDPQNPMLKNLVDSSFCSPLKGSRSKKMDTLFPKSSTTADDEQEVNSGGHLNGVGDTAGKGTLSRGSTPKKCVDVKLDHTHQSTSASEGLSSESLNEAKTETFCDVKVHMDDIMTSNSLECEKEQTNASTRKYRNVVRRDISGLSSNKVFNSSSNKTVNSPSNGPSSRTKHSFSDRTIEMGNSSEDSSRNSDIDSFSNKTIVNSCGNVLTDQIPSVTVSVSHKNIANAAEEVFKVNQTQPNEQVNMTTYEIGCETRNGTCNKSVTESVSGNCSKDFKEEKNDMCNKMLMDSLQDMVDSVTFLESGVCMKSQPVDCGSTANSALCGNNIEMKETTDSNKVCETKAEHIGNEETDQKVVAVLQDGCSKIDLFEPDSENCLELHNKQVQDHAIDGHGHLSESDYCVHNSFDEINKIFQNNGGLQFEFNQTKDASLTQANEENYSIEQNLDQSVDFPYCSCDDTQEGSDVPVEQIFVHEGQMYQLSHANIVRFGNLEFYAFLRDDSLHVPLGNFLRVVDKEVKSIFQSAVKFERLQLPCLTLDEMYLLEQKCGVYYDSTNMSLISLVTLQEICVLLLNIQPDSMTLKMLAFCKPCQRTLGSQLRCSVCGLSKKGKHLDTYIPVNHTGDQNPKVEATVGALTIGGKGFTSFELKGKVYMSLKNVFQQKLVKLKTLQLRLKKLNSETIVAPMEIEEYFCMQGVDVDHTMWIDMVTLRCLICMGQLSRPELVRIAQGEFIYKPSYYLFCEDTSRTDTCFEVNSVNGELIRNNYFKDTGRSLPFILTKGGDSLAERIKDDSISGNENIDTVIDESGLINGPRRKYTKSVQTGRIDKNSFRPRKSCRPRKKKTSSDMYFFSENDKMDCNRENENDQEECKDGVKKQCHFRKLSSGGMKMTSQYLESDGKAVLKPGDYIVRNYEKFYEKMDAGYIVGKGNDNTLVHLQSEEKLAASALELAKGIDVFTGILKENKDTLSNQVQQFSDSGYKQGNILGLNVDLKFLETKESTKTDSTEGVPLEAENNSALDEENKAKNYDDMSSKNQGSLDNELKQAVTMSNPSSEDLQNFIDRFSTLDSDTVKNLKFCDASLTPNKIKLKNSAESVTDCSEEGMDFSSVRQFKKSQINEVEEVDNCIQFVTGINCIRPEAISEEFLSAEKMRKHSVTIEEHLIKANICEEGDDLRRFETDLHERSIANVEDNDLLCSVETAQVTQTVTEKPDGIEGIGHRQCKQDAIEQSEEVSVTQEKTEDVCNSEEDKDLTLEDRTQENTHNPAQNVKLEKKCEVEMAEIQPEQNIDTDGRIGNNVQEMRREMEDNIRKYLVFMYVKEGDQPGFRVKKFKEGAEKVFPALFVPDPEHLETKFKRMKFMRAAAKYMDGLFHSHTQKLLEKKLKMSESSSVGSSTIVKDICESNSQLACYTVKAKSKNFFEDKHEKVTGLPKICKESYQVDNNNYICCETKDKLTSHNKYNERENSTSGSSRKVECKNRENNCYETEEMLNGQEENGRRQIYTTDNSKMEGLIDQCQTTGIINKITVTEDDSENGKKVDDSYLEVTSITGDNNQETSNVNECKSIYTNSNIKYSAISDRKMKGSNRSCITSTQEQKPFKNNNDVSLVEINDLETVEGRLTRSRKRIISKKQRSIDKVGHLEKPEQDFAKMSSGETSTGLLKEDKTVLNKMAVEETNKDEYIKSGGDTIQIKCRRITRNSRVNFELNNSLNNIVSEFSEIGLKEKESVSSKQQQVKGKKKQKNLQIKHKDKQCFDQSLKKENQGNGCMSDCIIRLRENRKNTRNQMPVTCKRKKNKNIIKLGQDTLHISECYVKLKRIRLLDDAVTS